MKFIELTKEEFDNFALMHPQKSYIQTSKMGELKKKQGNKTWFVGIKKNNKILAATMMFSMNTFLNKLVFYAPRGILIDYHDVQLLDFFTKELKKFIKLNNGIKFIIDPKVVYQRLDSDGNSISDKDTLPIENLKKCGYHHFGFNKNFETIQVRHCAVVPIKGSYEEMLTTFTKTTRKHLLDLNESAIKVRTGTYEDLPIMEELFRASAENKHFEHKNLDYYKKMYSVMPEIMNIYIAYIDFDYEKELLQNKLEQAINDRNKIEFEMKRINVGSKMLKKQEQAIAKLKKLELQIKENAVNRKKYGKALNIGALLSIDSGDEYISLTSGMLEEFKNYNPKYAMYNEHIKDAIKKDKKIINFYGISGDLNRSNELYKIYELKKGFNCEIVELIGQFSLPINFYYYIYEIISNFKKKIKSDR